MGCAAGAAGLLTAALALAAHSAGGGALPSGPAGIELLLVAATVGVTAAVLPRAGEVATMLVLLGAGQLVGHGVLAAAGHLHSAAGAGPARIMAAAHGAAIVVGALLISAGDRLCRTVSRVLRRTLRPGRPPVLIACVAAAGRTDQPLHVTYPLISSWSYRGPPAGTAAR